MSQDSSHRINCNQTVIHSEKEFLLNVVNTDFITFFYFNLSSVSSLVYRNKDIHCHSTKCAHAHPQHSWWGLILSHTQTQSCNHGVWDYANMVHCSCIHVYKPFYVPSRFWLLKLTICSFHVCTVKQSNWICNGLVWRLLIRYQFLWLYFHWAQMNDRWCTCTRKCKKKCLTISKKTWKNRTTDYKKKKTAVWIVAELATESFIYNSCRVGNWIVYIQRLPSWQLNRLYTTVAELATDLVQSRWRGM